MNSKSIAMSTMVTTALMLAVPALAQDEGKLGTVHFATSCNAEAQKAFDRGMLFQHSFWYRASQKTFEDRKSVV